MSELIGAALNMPVFLLVLCRAGGIMISAPLFSNGLISVRIKVVLALLLALIMYPFAAKYSGPLPVSVLAYVPIVLTEVGLGLLMGFAGGLVLAILLAAGGIATQQIGLTLGELASPNFDEDMDEISVFFDIIGILLFLAVDGHHWFIQALAISYHDIPLGHFTLRPEAATNITNSFCMVFTYALRGAAPLMAIMFLVNVAVAVLSKAVPQMNILMVGYPVKVFVGLLSMILTFPLMWPVMRDAFGNLHYQLLHFARYL